MNHHKIKMLPVLILNMGYSGLGIARNLYGRGMKIYGLTAHPEVPAAKTRMCDKVIKIPDSREEPEALAERLLEIIRELGSPCIIFPTRDDDVLFLDRYKDRLSQSLIIPQPGSEVLKRVMDKFILSTIAKEAGVPTPATYLVPYRTSTEHLLPKIRFPAIVKPRMSVYWRRKGNWRRMGAQKAILVEDDLSMRQILSRIRETGADAIVQEFIHGEDTTLVSCCCYINRKGELSGYFCSRKVLQAPPQTGTGCLVIASDLPEIVQPTIRLLRACNYRGMAEVEYKYDASRNEYQLIEINPRHWDQHELGRPLGVNLTWAIYADYMDIPFETMKPTYNGRVNWIAERELVMEIGRRIKNRLVMQHGDLYTSAQKLDGIKKNQSRQDGNFFRILRAKKIWAGLRWSDPRASFHTILSIVREGAIQAGKRFIH